MSNRHEVMTLPDGSSIPLWTPRPSMVLPKGEYVYPWEMSERAAEFVYGSKRARAWRYRNKWTTLMQGSGKNSYRFKKLWGDWTREVSPFVDACASAGFVNPMPGSYAYPWTEWHTPPPTNPTLQVVLSSMQHRASAPQAWNEAVKKGHVRGRHYVYDLNSAYAWAASIPLPDPRRVIYTKRVTARPFGFYLVRLPDARAEMIPRRLRVDVPYHWMTKEEIERLDVHSPEVIRGCEWETAVDLTRMIDKVRETFDGLTAKRVLRAFWGGWSCERGVDQFMLGDGVEREMKPLPSRQYCPVWSAHVLSRVAMRCATTAGNTLAHVYTDSIMTTKEIVTGSEIGFWKLTHTIDDPWIVGAGMWGPSKDHLVKHAGRKATTDEINDASAAFEMATLPREETVNPVVGNGGEYLRVPLVGESG